MTYRRKEEIIFCQPLEQHNLLRTCFTGIYICNVLKPVEGVFEPCFSGSHIATRCNRICNEEMCDILLKNKCIREITWYFPPLWCHSHPLFMRWRQFMKWCEVQSLEILGGQDFTTDLGNLFQVYFCFLSFAIRSRWKNFGGFISELLIYTYISVSEI
jgi:hypothetical protein